MSSTTLSSQEFDQDTDRARKAASDGPVFITDHGAPAHVLLNIEEYRRLSGGFVSLADALAAAPGTEDIKLDLPSRRGDLARAADFD
jgi:hypothetical protein